MPRTTLVLVTLVLLSANALAEGSAQHKATPILTAKDGQIKLTLRSSRAQLASDSLFEVSVQIENTSAKPIYINSNYLTLTLPPEVDPLPPSPNSWSQWRSVLGTGILEDIDPFKKVVPVQPGARMLVTIPVTQQGFWHRLIAGVRLVPADYTMHVVCAYWANFEDAEKRLPNYSTEVADLTVAFVAPLPTILGGAALGGFLAFILLPNLWLPVHKKFGEHHWAERVFIVFRGFALSSLLSVVVAILLSRVSDSQFVVKVSVQDFWGAVAIGFIAAASGTGVLQRWNLSQAQRVLPKATETPTNIEEKKTQLVKEAEADASTSAARAA